LVALPEIKHDIFADPVLTMMNKINYTFMVTFLGALRRQPAELSIWLLA